MEARKNLEILIGDDLFADPIVSRSLKRSIEPIKEILKHYKVGITYASTPKAMIQVVSAKSYDLIVTDLDYGTTGRVGTEGFEILDAINTMNPKPYILLCTSQDTHKEAIQKCLASGKLNAVVGPGSFNKFSALKDHLIHYYSKTGAPAEGEKPLQAEGGRKNEK